MTMRFESGPLTGLVKPSVPYGEAPSNTWQRLVATNGGQGQDLSLSRQALASRFNHTRATSKAPTAVSIPSLSQMMSEPQATGPTASAASPARPALE